MFLNLVHGQPLKVARTAHTVLWQQIGEEKAPWRIRKLIPIQCENPRRCSTPKNTGPLSRILQSSENVTVDYNS